MTATWLPVRDWPYEVSDDGEVRRIGGKPLKPYVSPKGYSYVTLSDGPRRKNVQLHILILDTFIGERPEGSQTRHLDGDQQNNALSNLRWGTPSENNQDRVRHGTHHESRKTHCPRGHALVLPNLVASAWRRGGRTCLSCQREMSLARYYGRLFDPKLADKRYSELMEEA